MLGEMFTQPRTHMHIHTRRRTHLQIFTHAHTQPVVHHTRHSCNPGDVARVPTRPFASHCSLAICHAGADGGGAAVEELAADELAAVLCVEASTALSTATAASTCTSPGRGVAASPRPCVT